MKAFPAVTVPNIGFIQNLFERLNNGEKIGYIKARLGKKNVSEALSILTYLGYVEGKGVGRNRRYYKRKTVLNLERDYMQKSDVELFLSTIISETTNRRKLVEKIYGDRKESNRTKMKRITAIATLGRHLGIIRKGRAYKLTDKGKKELMRYVLEKVYTELKKKYPVSYIPISEVRREFLKEINLGREMFDQTLLELNNDGIIYLTTAPTTDEKSLKEGIATSNGVFQHIRIDNFKYYG